MIGMSSARSFARDHVKLVSHRSIVPALERLEEARLVPEGLESTDTESDAELRAHFAEALAELQAAEGPRGVLVAPQHQLASLLQTYLTENPQNLKLVDEPAAGALEVKYDEGDILGWARSLLDQALADVKGSPAHLEAFRLYLDGQSYDAISEKTGLTETAAKVAVHRLRGRLRKTLIDRIAETVDNQDDLDAELSEFVHLLS